MKRLHIVLVILIAVLASLVINVVFGGYIAARLATLPLVRQLNLINPRAPIVINTQETVRVSDSNDAVETINAAKTKLSALVYYEQDRLVPAGSLLNWTSDGYFMTTAQSFLAPGKTYAVLAADGSVFPIIKVHPDTASSLVLVQTDARGLATVTTAEDKTLRPGQKLLFASTSFARDTTTFLESYVRALSADVPNKEFDSDRVVRGVSAQAVSPLVPGAAALSLDGQVAGIWDGNAIIASDAIRTFANNFFNENRTVNRAGFGFMYRHVSTPEAAALKLAAGALVTAVDAGQAAALGGLEAGDSIVAVRDQQVGDSVLLESILEKVRPGEQIRFDIVRAGNRQAITVTPTLLK